MIGTRVVAICLLIVVVGGLFALGSPDLDSIVHHGKSEQAVMLVLAGLGVMAFFIGLYVRDWERPKPG